MPDQRKPCRCLLAESAPDLAVSVREYIALLDEEHKANDVLYQERLSLCLACDHLHDGTCALCGCYVEARAAKVTQRCALVPPRW